MKTLDVRARKWRAALRCGEPGANERDTFLPPRMARGQAPPDTAARPSLRRSKGCADQFPRRGKVRRIAHERRQEMRADRGFDRQAVPPSGDARHRLLPVAWRSGDDEAYQVLCPDDARIAGRSQKGAGKGPRISFPAAQEREAATQSLDDAFCRLHGAPTTFDELPLHLDRSPGNFAPRTQRTIAAPALGGSAQASTARARPFNPTARSCFKCPLQNMSCRRSRAASAQSLFPRCLRKSPASKGTGLSDARGAAMARHAFGRRARNVR
jgi:hypothetical protein